MLYNFEFLDKLEARPYKLLSVTEKQGELPKFTFVWCSAEERLPAVGHVICGYAANQRVGLVVARISMFAAGGWLIEAAMYTVAMHRDEEGTLRGLLPNGEEWVEPVHPLTAAVRSDKPLEVTVATLRLN